MFFYAPETPAPLFFLDYLRAHQLLAGSAEKADWLVLPFMYEVIYDYEPAKLAQLGLGPQQVQDLKLTAQHLDTLSVKLNKPLIVFFYRDPTIQLPFANALVFRTSGFASKGRKGEWGMPAFIERKPANTGWVPRNRPEVPVVSFRGKAAPEKHSITIGLHEKVNRLLERTGIAYRVKNYQPEGYLLRRRAVLSCKKAAGALQTDFLLNPAGAAIEDYLRSFRESDYIICAAGFGNYSYRLYETLREGRIPVHIDSNQLLPCADVIPWKDLMVWVPAARVDQTAQYLLDFHTSLSPDGFVKLQYRLREVFENYLRPDSFARYLVHSFLPAVRY